MSRGKSFLVWALGAACGSACVGGAWAFEHWHSQHAENESAHDEKRAAGQDAEEEKDTAQAGDADSPSASVKVAAVEGGRLTRVLRAYGSVITRPSSLRQVSWPQDVRVKSVLVAPGQHVGAGAALAEIELSADVVSQRAIARQAAASARAALDNAKARLEARLATAQDLLAAQAALADANAKLEALTRIKLPDDGLLRADDERIVSAVAASAGQILPANSPLMTLEKPGDRMVEVGIAPEQLGAIAAGSACTLRLSGRTADVPAKVALVRTSLDQATRLVPVQVEPTGDHPITLLTGERGEVEFPLEPLAGMLVPRASILPDGSEEVVFILEPTKDGTFIARRRPVSVAPGEPARAHEAPADDRVLVTSGLHAGDRVVVTGQTQLLDGMAVRVLTSSTPETGSGPAGASPAGAATQSPAQGGER